MRVAKQRHAIAVSIFAAYSRWLGCAYRRGWCPIRRVTWTLLRAAASG